MGVGGMAVAVAATAGGLVVAVGGGIQEDL